MLQIFLERLIKTDAIKAAEDDLSKIKLDDTTVQLSDDQLGIGHKTWAYLSEKEDYLDSNVKRIFFRGVRDFTDVLLQPSLRSFHSLTLLWRTCPFCCLRIKEASLLPQSSI